MKPSLRRQLGALLILAFAALHAQSKSYPSTSLQCFSSLTKPSYKLICPEARNKYCVKQVSTLTQNLCGATQYFGDIYTNKECQFKKCSDTCEEGTTTFEFEGKQYTRQTYCCGTDYCNSASSRLGAARWLLAVVALLSVFLACW